MTRRHTRPRMSRSQHWALSNTDEDGRITVTDRRILNALDRQGWAKEHVQERRRRRPRRWWTITDAGRTALASDPEIVVPRPIPDWRCYWDAVRVSPRQHVAAGHGIVRPGAHMLWRVRCPAVLAAAAARGAIAADTEVHDLDIDEEAAPPVGYDDTLAEIVETLDRHLKDPARACAGRRDNPQPIDLDALT